MNKKLIEPKLLKGFRDHLPNVMLQKKKMIAKLEKTFESFGFAPIDTPVLEFTEILLGKGGDETDKQLYRFLDNGKRDVTMRYDLTVPLARFTAQHYNELGMPFKAYHIDKVWRGENTHRGRFREFHQCDFDILGTNSNFSDVEIGLVIYTAINNLIGSDDFIIRINNRKILNALTKKLGVEDKTTDILRIIDKIYKQPREKVIDELNQKVGLSEKQIQEVLSFIDIKGSNSEILKELESLFSNVEYAKEGIENLKEFYSLFTSMDIPEKCYQIDLSIARGLDYYTGTVFETMLSNLPELGSICSGGRYDNLTELYTTNKVAGVGASIGLDRLTDGLEMDFSVSTPAQVLIANMDKNYKSEYLKIARELRLANVKTDLFTDDKKLDKQLKYANRKGFRFVIILGSNEFENNTVALKDMNDGNIEQIQRDELVKVFLEKNQL